MREKEKVKMMKKVEEEDEEGEEEEEERKRNQHSFFFNFFSSFFFLFFLYLFYFYSLFSAMLPAIYKREREHFFFPYDVGSGLLQLNVALSMEALCLYVLSFFIIWGP